MTAETVERLEAGAAAPAANPHRPLRVREKAVFATGDMVEGGLNYSLATFLLFYLTGVCGLSGSMAGLALSLTLFVDAVWDPLVGYLSDNTRSRWGRRHPYLIGTAAPLALTLALLFSIPAGLSGWPLFGYVVLVLLAERILHSSFLLPYGAMGAELSRDYRERSSVSAYRSLFGSFGVLLVLGLGFGVFLNTDSRLLDRQAYAAYGWTVAGLLLALMLVCGLGTLPMRVRLQEDTSGRAPSPRQFVSDLADAARNRSFMVLFASIVIFWVAQGAAGALGLHAYKYFWNAPAEFLKLVPVLTVAGALTGVPLAGLALRRFEKQQVCVAGVLIYCFGQTTSALAHIFGLTPESGAALFVLLGLLVINQTWALAAIGVSFWSMMADCTDEHAHLFGARREGLFFAAASFSTKAAIALGSLIASVGLDLIGFPREIAKLGPHPCLRRPPCGAWASSWGQAPG